MPKISALPIANSATTGDLLVLDQGNVTKRIDFNVLQSAVANAGVVQNLIARSLTSALTLPISASNVSFTQTGPGAITTTVAETLKPSVSVLAYGANTVPGSTDMLAAFNKAIASFGTGSGGGVIRVPRGVYFLSDDLNISKQIHLVGDGGIDVFGTKLLFSDGKGVRVYHSGDSPDGNDGSWSVIKNIGVVAQAKTVSTSGFRISGHGVRLENFFATGFKNKGIFIGNAANGGVGNANNWILDNGRLTSNDSDGLFVDGADSNAGVAILVDASSNGGFGIYDSSFLGNTYIACHSSTNTLGAYKTDDANAQNQLVGCYSESGQPASSLVSPTQVIGGLHGAGFTAGSNHSYVTAGGGNGLTRGLSGFQITQADGSANTIESRLGGDVNNADILYMSKSDVDSGFPVRFRWLGSSILVDRANLTQLYRMTAGAAPMWEFAAPMYPGTPGGGFQRSSSMRAGLGVPSNTLGSSGDFYFRGDGGLGSNVYKKLGSWSPIL